MGWTDPRPNDFTEAGLRARLKSLQDWLADPEFNDGVRLGSGAAPTYDSSTGVSAPPAGTAVTAENVALFTQDAIQSDNYDGTNVAAADATVGWRLERNTGALEAGNARIRGEVIASEFHGSTPANLCTNPSFTTDTTGWTAGADSSISRTTSATADATNPAYRSSPGNLRIVRSAGSGTASAIHSVTVAPGDVITAGAWMSANTVVYGNAFTVTLSFYAGATLKRTETRSEKAAAAGSYQYIEKTFAIPAEGSDWATVDSCKVEFGGNMATTTAWIGLDDVTIGLAPLMEIPYLVTDENSDHARAFVLPDNIGFQRNAGYATGMRDVGGELEVWGPLAAGGRIPALKLQRSSDGNSAEVRFVADTLYLQTGGMDILGAWGSYTPTFYLGANAIGVGDGSVVGRYMQIGKTVHFYAQLNVGSSTSFPADDTITSTLPVSGQQTSMGGLAIGLATATDGSITRNGLASVVVAAHRVGFYGFNDAYATATAPVALYPPAAGKYIIFSGTYEAA